jgi:predicted nucleic acid-binding protein
MALYLLDTNAVSDAIREHPRIKVRLAAQPGELAISVTVLGEIRYGLERLPAGKRRDALEIKAQRVFAALPCTVVTEEAANTYARVRRAVEAEGLALDDNDLWIAATALTLPAVLVSRDSDFARVPNLEVQDWTT